MLFLIGKTLHIVGFISWFAGLFYIVRLFVYHAEASNEPENRREVLQPQYVLMAARLWRIITTPAMVLTLVGGGLMLWQLPAWAPWLHLKLSLVGLLLVYHHLCGSIRRQQALGTSKWTAKGLRVFNEGATMLMVAIVCLAVFKTSLSALAGVLILLGLGVSLMLGIRLYGRSLERAKPQVTAPSADADVAGTAPVGSRPR